MDTFYRHPFRPECFHMVNGVEVQPRTKRNRKRNRKRKQNQNQSKRSNYMSFIQHIFGHKVSINFDVKILVSPVAFHKMTHYVGLSSDEIGWLGTCFERPDGTFFISDVFLPEQQVNSATTEIEGDAMAEMITTLLTDHEEGVELVNNLRFWGHSHVNMGTSASGQDDKQMKDFVNNETPYFLRGICNKKGRMEFSLFHYDRGFVIHDVPWAIEYDQASGLEEQIKGEIKDKVSRLTYATNYAGNQAGYGYGRNGVNPGGQGRGGGYYSQPSYQQPTSFANSPSPSAPRTTVNQVETKKPREPLTINPVTPIHGGSQVQKGGTTFTYADDDLEDLDGAISPTDLLELVGSMDSANMCDGDI